MSDPTPDHVEELLAASGLAGPEFDPDLLAVALSGWLTAGRDLVRLLAESEDVSGDPTRFSASW